MKTRKSEIILQKAQRWNLSGVSFLHTGKHRKGLRRLKRAVKLLETLNFKEKGKVQDEYLSICIVLGDYFREKFDKNPYVRAMSSIGPVILTDGNMINAIKYYEDLSGKDTGRIIEGLRAKLSWIQQSSKKSLQALRRTLTSDPFFYKLRVIEVIDSTAITKVQSKKPCNDPRW